MNPVLFKAIVKNELLAMLIGENLILTILALISHNDSNKIKVILIRSFYYFEFYEHLS